MTDKKRNISLYIHIPFCFKKCFYCDFLSAPADTETKDRYVEVLKQEISIKSEKYKSFKVDSIFFGGGTPSILPASQIQEMLQLIKKKFTLTKEVEVSIEVNPGTVDKDKLIGYRSSGINRLSIGLQSADNRELKVIGRIHTFEDFLQTYESARQAGFQNINIDLMSALPGQTIRSYRETLKKVLSLQPEHISAYSLIIEEGTPFYERYGDGASAVERKHCPSIPDEETERAMYELTDHFMQENDYHRYEISNYAKEGYECKHNKGYWERHNYLGLGLGSASLIHNCRWNNESRLPIYLEGIFDKKKEQILTEEEQMEEFMFLGLRLMKGVSEKKFKKTFGVTLESVYEKQIRKLVEGQLLIRAEGNLRLTKKGIDLSNIVMAEFLL